MFPLCQRLLSLHGSLFPTDVCGMHEFWAYTWVAFPPCWRLLLWCSGVLTDWCLGYEEHENVFWCEQLQMLSCQFIWCAQVTPMCVQLALRTFHVTLIFHMLISETDRILIKSVYQPYVNYHSILKRLQGCLRGIFFLNLCLCCENSNVTYYYAHGMVAAMCVHTSDSVYSL